MYMCIKCKTQSVNKDMCPICGSNEFVEIGKTGMSYPEEVEDTQQVVINEMEEDERLAIDMEPTIEEFAEEMHREMMEEFNR